MPMYHNNHGRTTAMWTGTTIVTLGFLVGTIAGHREAPAPLDDPKADLIALIRRADLSPEILAAITNLVRDFRRDRAPDDQSS